MSTMVDPPLQTSPKRETESQAPQPVTLPDGRPNLAVLEDQLPHWLKASKSLAILTGVLGATFFIFSRLAIFPTDIWGHLAYGRWMVAHQAIPQTEPLLPLARGVPWVDVAWLSKLTGFWAFNQFGIPGLQFLHAAAMTVSFVALAWIIQSRTRRVGWTIIGLAAAGLVNCFQYQIQRPQDFGIAAFAIVLAWSLAWKTPRWSWVGLPLLFAFWGNLHGTFLAGLATLGVAAAGRFLDVWRLGGFRLACQSRQVWRAVLMLQLCAAAVLINPMGLKIYPDALSFAIHPNLDILHDWYPLTLRMGQGQVFFVVVVLLAIALRFSPRRLTGTEGLLLLGTCAASLWSQRMLVWFGPVAGYCLAVHGAAAWSRWRRSPLLAPAEERRGIWTVTTIGLCWIFFAYTPFGLQRLHGMPTGKQAEKEFRSSVAAGTPLDAVEYLHANADELPGGLMYNSQEWGDFLQWAAPQKFGLFVNSHVHLIPEEVWQDYLSIINGGGDPSKMLDRYGVTTVLVNTTNYAGLVRVLRDDPEWQESYTSPGGGSVLFVRKRPI